METVRGRDGPEDHLDAQELDSTEIRRVRSKHDEDANSHTSEDFDWEKPPAYSFHGSGPQIETSVVAQGRAIPRFAIRT